MQSMKRGYREDEVWNRVVVAVEAIITIIIIIVEVEISHEFIVRHGPMCKCVI